MAHLNPKRCARKAAHIITQQLHGDWRGHYGSAPCPVCQPEGRVDQRALSLRDDGGRLLIHCHKGGCGFIEIARALSLPRGAMQPDPDAAREADAKRKAEAEKRAAQALRLWTEAAPINGTAAESYLRGRGITCALPDTLRFHPETWHGPTARHHPAMIALIQGAGSFAVHRTYLAEGGVGKAAIQPNKMMLGAAAGGAVRLMDGAGPLAVGEGVETSLSLASGLLRCPAQVWAAMSASGMAGLRLPPEPGKLTIATDGDDAGRAAGRKLAERAHALGWRVSILPAPDRHDWNSILNLKGGAA